LPEGAGLGQSLEQRWPDTTHDCHYYDTENQQKNTIFSLVEQSRLTQDNIDIEWYQAAIAKYHISV
jgi:hypothetical protein